MRAPSPEQRKTLKQMLRVAVLMWVIALATFLFGDFRMRIVPTGAALLLTASYFAARSTFDMKNRDEV